MSITKEASQIFERFEIALDEAKTALLADLIRNLVALLQKHDFTLVDFLDAVCEQLDGDLLSQATHYVELAIAEVKKAEGFENAENKQSNN